MFERAVTPAVRFRFLWGQFGTLLKVLYGCDRGDSGVWYSQPMMRGMAAGNLLLSSAILFTGLTYDRVRELSDTLRIPILSFIQNTQNRRKPSLLLVVKIISLSLVMVAVIHQAILSNTVPIH